MTTVYYVRYLPKKAAGLGEIVHSFASTAPMDLEEAREKWPERFERPGFYCLLVGTDQNLNVEEPK
jgi:hypothetical protein